MSGPALWERMQNSWGYLATGGYNGHVFPVVIGETGSLYTSVSLPPTFGLALPDQGMSQQRLRLKHTQEQNQHS